ncbi:hypothetical protein WOLCODRAFT_160843 [Wolfiporia cocos MD-104 SS10]|uniref:Uncharacterized protein n=1 Tax=Wolfiporia cocos (strain MD-104) TaxID=742152 RepID=A0A2H3IWL7_WOLCO|nr:hypothetical protein WOLCODRAFT_160843 [Wolfiporia cocos MD-104 SS10]
MSSPLMILDFSSSGLQGWTQRFSVDPEEAMRRPRLYTHQHPGRPHIMKGFGLSQADKDVGSRLVWQGNGAVPSEQKASCSPSETVDVEKDDDAIYRGRGNGGAVPPITASGGPSSIFFLTHPRHRQGETAAKPQPTPLLTCQSPFDPTGLLEAPGGSRCSVAASRTACAGTSRRCATYDSFTTPRAATDVAPYVGGPLLATRARSISCRRVELQIQFYDNAQRWKYGKNTRVAGAVLTAGCAGRVARRCRAPRRTGWKKGAWRGVARPAKDDIEGCNDGATKTGEGERARAEQCEAITTSGVFHEAGCRSAIVLFRGPRASGLRKQLGLQTQYGGGGDDQP